MTSLLQLYDLVGHSSQNAFKIHETSYTAIMFQLTQLRSFLKLFKGTNLFVHTTTLDILLCLTPDDIL